MSVPRSGVVWWGTHPPADISRELDQRHLRLAVSEDETAVLDSEVRALLLPHHWRKGIGALRSRAARLRIPLGNRGGRLFVVAFGEAERQLAVTQLPELQDVEVLDGTAAASVAEKCARWDPGRPLGAASVVSAKAGAVTEGEELLLRRAFSEFDRIEVSPLSGGLKAASVWQVRAMYGGGRSPQPFLVKAGERVEITEEIDTMRDFVVEHMPFTNRPPLLLDRCVSGFDQRLLVSMLVERCSRLDDYLAQGGTPDPVIGPIFDGPLRCWRSCRTKGERTLGLVYEQLRVRGARDPDTGRYRKDADLELAHRLAQEADPSAPEPLAVMSRVVRYPKRVTTMCQAHGDLHPRNIFVRDQTAEVVLIDFAKSGQMDCPIALDSSTLDVALAFDGWREPRTAVSLAEIEALYTPPLFQNANKQLSSRGQAIVALRRHARADCEEEAEYTIAIVASLLRTARLLATARGREGGRGQLIATCLRAASTLAGTLP